MNVDMLKTIYGIKYNKIDMIDYNYLDIAINKGLLDKNDIKKFIFSRFINRIYDTELLVDRYLKRKNYDEEVKFIYREDYEYFLTLLNKDLQKSFNYMDNIDRNRVEDDPTKLQVIVYMRVLYDNKTVVLYRKNTEKRTSNQYDFPAGHISSEDIGYNYAIYRELEEELGLNKEDIKDIKYVTYIEPTTDIELSSTYHLGLIFDIEVYNSAVLENKEYDKHDIEYLEYLDFEDINILKRVKSWFLESMIYFNYI